MIKSASRSSITNDQKYRSMLADAVPSSEYLISSTVLDTNTPSVTFDVSSFAGVYKHLQIVIAARTDRALHVDSAMIQFNGDTGGNYRAHYLLGTGSAVASGDDGSGVVRVYAARVTGATAGTSVFGTGICDILDPYSSTKNTTTRALAGYTSGSGSEVYLFSGLWMNTAAINSIRIFPNIGSNFVAGSRFSLYGVTA